MNFSYVSDKFSKKKNLYSINYFTIFTYDVIKILN